MKCNISNFGTERWTNGHKYDFSYRITGPSNVYNVDEKHGHNGILIRKYGPSRITRSGQEYSNKNWI